MKRPSFQFYPGDWMNDAALRTCSVFARGMWVDMLCLMHQGTPYGFLKVNGMVITTSKLALIVGCTETQATLTLRELQDAGVFSMEEDGSIFSRRMVNDEKLRKIRAEGGKLGGNPFLIGSKGKTREVKSQDNVKVEEVNPKGGSPSKSGTTPSSSSSSSSSLKTEEADPPIKVNQSVIEKGFVKPSLAELQLAFEKAGCPTNEAQKFLNHYESNGWKVGKNPMKSWPHAVGNWAMNARGSYQGGPLSPINAPAPVKSLMQKLVEEI